MPLTNRAHRNAVATQCLLTLDLGPRQILLADRTHDAVSEGRGGPSFCSPSWLKGPAPPFVSQWFQLARLQKPRIRNAVATIV
jgi:hypothetical protein